MSFSAISIDVIDPLNRTGKITIPAHYIIETKGLLEFWSGSSITKDLSLCLLFQKGRCNAGNRCHQVHAAPEFVTKLRSQAEAGRACCALHGDFQSNGFLSDSRSIAVVGPQAVSYPIHSFARTTGLDMVLHAAGATPKVAAAKICRLHSRGACKFGKDCKNIHVCPDAKAVVPRSVGIQNRASDVHEKAVAVAALEYSSSMCGLSTTSAGSSPSTHRHCRTPESGSFSPESSPKDAPLSRLPTPPPAPVAPLAFFGEDTIWKMPEAMSLISPSSWMVGFENSLSQIAADLSMMNCSPSFRQQ